MLLSWPRRHCGVAVGSFECNGTGLLTIWGQALCVYLPLRLTNRWSQPLAVAMRPFNFMKQFPIFAALAAASGG